MQNTRTFFFVSLAFGAVIGIFFTFIFKIPSSIGCNSRRAQVNPYNNLVPESDSSFIRTEKHYLEEKEKFNVSVAKRLYKEVRILCWILTSPKTIKVKGQAVKDTWGKRCNKLIFMSSEDDPSYPSVNLGVPEGRENLWGKTKAAFRYVYRNHLNDADWFLKADDDTFAVVENMRHFLSRYNPDDSHFFGRWFTPFNGYNSGGAGYILSRKSVRQFVRASNNPWKCPEKHFAEDVAMGVCLGVYNIHPEDTRDHIGRQTFHPYAVDYHLIPGYISKDDWLHSYDKFPVEVGPKCCSDHSITFHYVSRENMYVYDYFIHHLYPYGIGTAAGIPKRHWGKGPRGANGLQLPQIGTSR